MGKASTSVPGRPTAPRAVGRLPLNALRVFEAIAHTGSMARAADLLNVQPSAVSMQLKLLAAHVGRPLWRKEGRNIALTADGAALAAEIGASLGQIESALRALRIAARSEPIVLSVLPNFLNSWLLVRLGRLEADLPDLDLRLHSSNEPVVLGAGGADAAVRSARAAGPVRAPSGWPRNGSSRSARRQRWRTLERSSPARGRIDIA